MTIAELKTSVLLNQSDENGKICPECGTDMEEGSCPECDNLDKELGDLDEDAPEGLSESDEDWIR